MSISVSPLTSAHPHFAMLELSIKTFHACLLNMCFYAFLLTVKSTLVVTSQKSIFRISKFALHFMKKRQKWCENVQNQSNISIIGWDLANQRPCSIQNFMNRSKRTAFSYWDVFLWMAISKTMFDISDLFCTFTHYFWRSFTKWRANVEILKIYFLMTSHF